MQRPDGGLGPREVTHLTTRRGHSQASADTPDHTPRTRQQCPKRPPKTSAAKPPIQRPTSGNGPYMVNFPNTGPNSAHRGSTGSKSPSKRSIPIWLDPQIRIEHNGPQGQQVSRSGVSRCGYEVRAPRGFDPHPPLPGYVSNLNMHQTPGYNHNQSHVLPTIAIDANAPHAIPTKHKTELEVNRALETREPLPRVTPVPTLGMPIAVEMQNELPENAEEDKVPPTSGCCQSWASYCC